MGDDDNWRSELDISGLSLMDEDDSLLFSSSFPDPTTYQFSDIDKEDRGLSLFGDTYNYDEETMVATTLQGKEEEEVLQPHESPEPHRVMKYNLRKSLAWDKAFFTNPGVLEPDELSNMIESNHMGEKKNLPSIQEDVNKSTESISTLQSDCTVETSQVLFEDVRASIQSSAVSSDAATPDKTPSTLEDPGSQEKMKPNAVRKRPSIRAQGLGKVTKQPVAAKEHNTTISRPSTGLGRSVRASIDVNKTKHEKNPNLTGGKEPLAPRVPLSRRTQVVVTKPVVPFKSALRSSVASKNELTSSCSSLESCLSVSSSASIKSSLDTVKQKKAQSLRTASHSKANGSTSRAASILIGQSRVPPLSASRTYKSKLSSNASLLTSSVDWSLDSPRGSTSRAASKSIGQSRVPPLSASRTYKSKLSSNASLFSSSVDWSLGSPRASTPSKMAKGNKKTFLGESSRAIDYTPQTLKALKTPKDISAVQDDPKPDQQSFKRGSVPNGGTVRSAPMTKSTGLRVPSPKVGYFDGARSSVARTPTGSCTGPVSVHGARGLNESTASSRPKPGKFQPRSSRLMQESTNSNLKANPVSSSPRLIVSASVTSPTNKMYSKVSAAEQLTGNAEDILAQL